eukprot:CAMPEP_0113488310 /NCGR_PEP_ID=MMETSP0014_2-20120614/25952_1 /TAXON_ID=2857 /ORGANISM="Nitzschia sp." /LENGTH=194 /DNA_ID=CAMNT_0000382021 /DNA_START=123 /DNA_END=707 /DNA_ORIENTATION=+ /assembly_acc=CAM_ASM_000159
MKFSSCITIAALVGSASAFAPSTSSQHKTTTALQAVDFSKEIGVQAPLGLWDPPGVLDGKSQAQFDRLRAQEIKHGRVAMLAVVGYLVTYAGARLPGLEDIPAGWAAWEKLPVEVNGQLAATLVMMEFFNDDKSGKAFPGDFRNGALDFGWDKQSPEWQRKKRTIELQQGRAAMMGIFGLMVHDAMGNVADILP